MRREGFAVVKNLFTPDDLLEAETLIDALNGGYTDLIAREPRFVHDMAPLSGGPSQVDQPEILYAACLLPHLEKTAMFRKCRAFARSIVGPVSRAFDHTIVKSAWNASETPWHQDSAFFRFPRTPTAFMRDRLHFWIPFQDVSAANGCMEFITGSHSWPFLPHRPISRADGSGVGLTVAPDHEDKRVVCPVARGDCTIHLPRTLHHTGRNMTGAPRKAWIVHFSRLGRFEIAAKQMVGLAPPSLPPRWTQDRS